MLSFKNPDFVHYIHRCIHCLHHRIIRTYWEGEEGERVRRRFREREVRVGGEGRRCLGVDY